MVVLTALGEGFHDESFDWETVRRYQLLNHCINPKRGSTLSCGKILAHAKAQITAFREKIGVRVCIFKIGVSSNPVSRFVPYLQQGFSEMWVIHRSNSVDLIHMLEAACIQLFGMHVGCRNQAESGGEGALNKASCPEPPFFLYVTGCTADQPRRIGG